MNGAVFFDTVENIVVKGENDCYKNFLLFQLCFKACFPGSFLLFQQCSLKLLFKGRYRLALCNIKPLPNSKSSDWSKLKELVDEKIDVTEKLKFRLGRVENIERKGENAGYKRLHYQGCQKLGLCGKELKG